jgi:aryl-alcohol dehydrogenase-like predicted oxidoreductase
VAAQNGLFGRLVAKLIFMERRTLGRSDISVEALGFGCWAIGGPFWDKGGFMGYGSVNDAESMRALECSLEMGARFFDVAGVYGCGHAERLLGKAIAKYPDVKIAAKFGYTFDETSRMITGTDITPTGIRTALEQSLKRLTRDHIDLYQLHLFDLPLEQALEVAGVLELLKTQGLIGAYSWCNEQPETIKAFASQSNASVVPIMLNVLEGNHELPEMCNNLDLGIIVRRPLGMGLLSGKLKAGHQFADNDMRTRFKWNLESGKQAKQLAQLETIKEWLTTGGRSLVQGALGWLWAFNENLVPIPGFKTVTQVKENVGAMQFGALPQTAMHEIKRILERDT